MATSTKFKSRHLAAPLTVLLVVATPVNAVSCTPSGFANLHSSSTKCSHPALLLIPLALSNFVVFASGILFSRLTLQNKLKCFGSEKQASDAWRPWSGLATVVLLIVQAVATAALIRAGGYEAAWSNLILLWLLRPRMQWPLMLFYALFGKQYRRAATDGFFAEGLLSLISLPVLAWFFGAMLTDGNCLDDFSGTKLEYGVHSNVQLLWAAVLGYMPVVAIEVLIFISFFWPGRRRLGRGWSAGAAFWSMAIFGLSWFFWAAWVMFASDDFCVTNIGPIAAIHAVVPLLSVVLRAWFT